MLNKVQSYAILSGDTARQITSSREQWTDFLRLAGRLYKYPFGEQLLIYAQRPEAAPNMTSGTAECSGMCGAAPRALL